MTLSFYRTKRETAADRLFTKEPVVSSYIPYLHHVTDTIISTDQGRFLTIFKLTGRSPECQSDATLGGWTEDLNQLLKSIGSDHLEFYTHHHHYEIDYTPEERLEGFFPRHFDHNYQKGFLNRKLWGNSFYLTLIYDPIADRVQKRLGLFEKKTQEEIAHLQEEAIKALEDISSQIMGHMKPYGIEQLGIYYRDRAGKHINLSNHDLVEEDETDTLDEEQKDVMDNDLLDNHIIEHPITPEETGLAFSSGLEFLSFLVNHDWAPVPVVQGAIRDYLCHTRPVFSLWGDAFQIRLENESIFSSGLEIREYEEHTEAGQFNLLLEADFEFLTTQSFSTLSLPSAKWLLSLQRRKLEDTNDPALSQINGIREGEDAVASRRILLGQHHFTLHVFAKTQKQAQDLARTARVLLNSCGVIAQPVAQASEAAFFATLPGNSTYRPRPAPINSLNFLDFNSFHSYARGKASGNPWGDAVMMFRTRIGSPYYFNFHPTPEEENAKGKRPAGHTLILGETGTGKSTLLSALLANATKFSPRMFIYDKDQGLAPLILALGGHYLELKDGVPTGWQPLQMDGTTANKAFVKRLIRLLAEISLKNEISHRQEEVIGQAVEAMMGKESIFPQEGRTLTHFVQLLAVEEGSSSLHELLAPWCREGQHGWLFDNDTDSIDLSRNDIYGFDLSDFITPKDVEAPTARTPLLFYLLYRIRSSIDGKRHAMIVLDEFAQYLDDPTIDYEIKRGLKTDRKKDCLYVFATQEPNDALESRIGKTIVQSVATKILLSNRGAAPEDYIDGLKLTPSEYEELVQISPQSRQFLIKQGDETAMASMRLEDMDDDIAILSGTPDNAEIIRTLIEQCGSADPKVWLPLFWNRLEEKRP
ncbi:VirB4 family type IV secretion/conjugal transfer ATPase [Entomobacter blattae]|uniref:Type IV secretion system protein virB4 n=1 Tax=Entomobacter blattae TaxID=2762277 RepID=A0A7H1NP48_9PROT|nr:VirB4 family type IV secretion/conjugal transfer ATPase [Entomobacter blattae]QNT77558.1 Type IV secretion system protein virB4 [Entomobacter blattae]